MRRLLLELALAELGVIVGLMLVFHGVPWSGAPPHIWFPGVVGAVALALVLGGAAELVSRRTARKR